MRVVTILLAAWLLIASPIAIAIARALRPPPPRPPEDWSTVTVNAEFAAIVRDWAETQR